MESSPCSDRNTPIHRFPAASPPLQDTGAPRAPPLGSRPSALGPRPPAPRLPAPQLLAPFCRVPVPRVLFHLTQAGRGAGALPSLLLQASLPPRGLPPPGGEQTYLGASLSPGQFAALLTAPPHPRDAHWGLSLPSRDLPASLVQGLGTLASSRRNRAGRAGVPNLVRSSPGLTTRRPSAPVLVSVTPWRRASSQRKEKARPLPCGHRLGNCRTLLSPLLTKADLHSTAKVQELSVNSCAPHRDSRQTPLSTPFAEGTCPGHRA